MVELVVGSVGFELVRSLERVVLRAPAALVVRCLAPRLAERTASSQLGCLYAGCGVHLVAVDDNYFRNMELLDMGMGIVRLGSFGGMFGSAGGDLG